MTVERIYGNQLPIPPSSLFSAFPASSHPPRHGSGDPYEVARKPILKTGLLFFITCWNTVNPDICLPKAYKSVLYIRVKCPVCLKSQVYSNSGKSV